MKQSLLDFCRGRGREDLLRSWNNERNAPLTPEDVSYGSHKKVWWRCGEGHEWQAAVYARTDGSGCPFCTGRRVSRGVNDLASVDPRLAGEWDAERNAPLTPGQVSAGSGKRVWWRCAEGHRWQASVKSRASGVGCPYCKGRVSLPGETDLATVNPELAGQWNVKRNGTLTPRDVTPGSSRRVWWVCECGHEWQAAVSSRARGTGCPVCAGKVVIEGENDLASRFPKIAAQWHPVKNGSLTPRHCAPASNRKVWWLCPEGHAYQAAVGSRTVGGNGCPYCAGKRVLAGFNDLASLEPEIAAQWHPTLNGTLRPDEVTVGSSRKVWWRCGEGHVWQAVIHSRTGAQKCGCPVCAGRAGKKKRYRYVASEKLAAGQRIKL